MLRRDTEHTVTGWVFTDRLVKPYYWLRSRFAERSIERQLGITGTRAQRRAQFRELLRDAVEGDDR